MMINQTVTDYDSVKVLREIAILKQLNNLSNLAYKNTKYMFPNDDVINGKNIFTPELIDIICPLKNTLLEST